MEPASTTDTLNHPHLRHLMTQLDEQRAQVEAFRQLSDEQLTRKPAPDKWNMLECIDHLNASGTQYTPPLRGALSRASATAHDAPYKPSLFARMFIKMVSPETKLKVKTFSAFEPGEALADREVFDRFLAQADTYAECLHEADKVNLNKTKLSSPVTKLVRFSIGEALTMLLTHQARHIQQAQRLADF